MKQLIGINFLPLKLWFDLMLLNTNTATKLLHHPPLKSKTTFVVKYISGMTRLDRENRCLSN
jgi:hypothetical protein